MAENATKGTQVDQLLSTLRSKYAEATKGMTDAEILMSYYNDAIRGNTQNGTRSDRFVDFLDAIGVDRRGLLGQFKSRKDPYYNQAIEWLAEPGVNETPEDAARRFGGVIKNKKDEDDYTLGFARSIFKGMTLNTGDEAAAALLAARDIALNGADPSEFGDRYKAYVNDERTLRREFERVHPLEAGSVQLISSVIPSLVTSGVVGLATNPWVRAGATAALGAAESFGYGYGEKNIGVPDEEMSDAQAVQQGLQNAPWGMLGAFGVPFGQSARRMLSATEPNPYVVEDAAYLRKQGVTSLPAGKATGASGLINFERNVAPAAFAKRMEETKAQLTNAALRMTGVQNLYDMWAAAGIKKPAWKFKPEDLNNVRQDNLNRIHSALSDQYTEFGKVASADLDGSVLQKVQDAIDNYRRISTSKDVPAALTDLRDKLRKMLKAGQTTIPGDIYVSMRSELGNDIRRTSDTNLIASLRDAQLVLDDAMHKWVGANKPDLAPVSDQLRNAYRKMIVIEDAAVVDPTSASKGFLTPEALQVGAQQNNLRGYARGTNDFAKLSEAALSVLGKEDADLMANLRRGATVGDALATVIPGASVGSAAYALAHDPGQALQLATLAGLTGYGVKKGTQAFVGSKLGQGVLEDTVLAGPRINPFERAAYAAIMPAVTQGRQTFGPALGFSNVAMPSTIPAENLGTAGIPLPDESKRAK